jgi:hypothetical protein
MWNYRIVRKKTVYPDSEDKTERVSYTYAIHEAYYDKNGYVGAVTQDPIEPFGETVQELRHSWVMMAEAFGQPILDYDDIPEPGYKREDDPIGSTLDERLREVESGEVESIPWEQVKQEMEEKFGPIDHEKFRREEEKERMEAENFHRERFGDIPTLEELIRTIYAEYRAFIERDQVENPWRYKAEDD